MSFYSALRGRIERQEGEAVFGIFLHEGADVDVFPITQVNPGKEVTTSRVGCQVEEAKMDDNMPAKKVPKITLRTERVKKFLTGGKSPNKNMKYEKRRARTTTTTTIILCSKMGGDKSVMSELTRQF